MSKTSTHPDRDTDSPSSGGSRWILFVLMGTAAVLLFIAMLRRGPDPVGVHHPSVGRPLESLELGPLLNTERTLQLEDLKGKITLINYWGPWCGYCLLEMPELLELEAKVRGSEAQVILVSSSGGSGQELEELAEESAATLKKFKADPAVYEDESQRTVQSIVDSAQLSGFGFPTTILLDPDNKLAGVWQGYHPEAVSQMEQAIEELLRESN